MNWVRVRKDSIVIKGNMLATENTGQAMLKEVYKKCIGGYPKFFKMDALCRLGFVASELLLQQESPRVVNTEHRAVILFNRSSSLCDDRNYQETIQDSDNFFPSPAVFVYTLPNIITGEISIRNKYYGETLFAVLKQFDAREIHDIVCEAFLDSMTLDVITGWVDCESDDDFEACMLLVARDENNFTPEFINEIYNK